MRAAAALIFLVLGGCSGVWTDRWVKSMIFFPSSRLDFQPAEFNLQADTVTINPDASANLFCWFVPPRPGRPVLLYLHGNAGNISHRLFIAKGWADRGYGCFLLDYRGYGLSTGTIRMESDLADDALAAYQWLRDVQGLPAGRIVLYGESIGCAPAIDLALREQVGAVVLIAPFTSLLDMSGFHYGLSQEWMVRNFQFDNESKIARLRSPVFILHGTADEIVPVQMGRRLFDKAPDPKEAWWIDGGRHNDLPDVAGRRFWDAPADFLNRLLESGR